MSFLLLFSFSPVQGFISASRKTKDLFAGSYIISYLTQEVIKRLNLEDKVIFPRIKSDNKRLANYPNRFVAKIYDKKLAEKVEITFKKVWREIYHSVWEELIKRNPIFLKVEDQFKEQVENYFSTFSVTVSLNENNYPSAYAYLEEKHGAIKSFRPYVPLVDTCEECDGCTVCGERPHLNVDWGKISLPALKNGERLCGVCLVKRYSDYYFKDKIGDIYYPSTEEIAGLRFKEKLFEVLKKDESLRKKFIQLGEKIKNTPYVVKNSEIASKFGIDVDSELFRKDAWESLKEEFKGFEDIKDNLQDIHNYLFEKYGLEHKNALFSILLLDGDSMGEWLGTKSSLRKEELTEEFHKKFSEKLSNYASDVAQKRIKGRVVYAGGDDLLAFIHPDDVLNYARYCSEKFTETLKEFAKPGTKPTISGAILITHVKTNLHMAMDNVRMLEKEAKSVRGKGSVAIGVLNRNNTIVYFLSKWEHITTFEDFLKGLKQDIVSSGLPYELGRILEEMDNLDLKYIIPLIKRTLYRKTKNRKVAEKFIHISEKFIEDCLEYFNSDAERRAISNYINMLYVARFIKTRMGESLNENI